MKTFSIILAILLLNVQFVFADEEKSFTMSSEAEYVPGEILIKFSQDPGLNENRYFVASNTYSVSVLNWKYKAKKFDKLKAKDNHIYKIKLDESQGLENIINEYLQNPLVEIAQPNYIYKPSYAPNDPYYSQQYSHNLTDAELAWNITTGSEDIVIAVIGTGIDYEHEDLSINMWENQNEIIDGNDTDNNGYIDDFQGWDFDDEDNDPMFTLSGHETGVAGVAAAKGNNALGVAGVCWNCKLMNLKTENYISADIIEAIEYATNNSANIISMSFVGGYIDPLLRDSLDEAYSQRILLVGGAGNNGGVAKKYPAAYDNVIAVGGSDENDERWDDGVYASNYGSWVNVAAPAKNIYTTNIVDLEPYAPGTGTSAATPYIAGVGGLILSYNPFLSVDEVRMNIEKTGDNINTDQPIGKRVNVFRALVCKGNFDEDFDVDGSDASLFKGDFGRSSFNNPCETGNSCNGDFDCDGDCDGTDASLFKSEFGRSQFSNPCPDVTIDPWCGY